MLIVDVETFTHTITGNIIHEKLNPDLYAPVGTDSGNFSVILAGRQ